MKSEVAPGTTLRGRYVIELKLDEGNMGAIYKASDLNFNGGAPVAIKQTFAEAEDLVLREQFKREADILAKLNHPALPFVREHFFEGSDQFLVMQFIDGIDLKKLSKEKNGVLTFAEVANWADTLLDALDHMHSQEPPVIHRDIKPANIKLNSKGRIFLLDFGLAKNASSPSSQGKTLHAFTKAYAPLEQIEDNKTDARSDLFSLGATLYHLLTGHLPKNAEVRYEVIKHGHDPLVEAHVLNPQLSPEVSKVLMRAMCLEPRARYQNASEMKQAWEEIWLYKSQPQEPIRNLNSQDRPSLNSSPPLIANGKLQKIVVALNAPDDRAKLQPEIALLQQTEKTAFENQLKLPQQKNDAPTIKPELNNFESEVALLRNFVMSVFSKVRLLIDLIGQYCQPVYFQFKSLVSADNYYSTKSNRIGESRIDPHNEKKKAARPPRNIEEDDEIYAVRPRRQPRRHRKARRFNDYFFMVAGFIILMVIFIGLSESISPRLLNSKRKARIEQFLKDWLSLDLKLPSPTPAPTTPTISNTSPRREFLSYALELFKSEDARNGQLVNGAIPVTGEQVFRFRFTPHANGWLYLLGRDLEERPLMLSVQQVSDNNEVINTQLLRLRQSSTANFTVILAPKAVPFLQGLADGQSLSREQQSSVSKLREQYKSTLLEFSQDNNNTHISANAKKNDLVIADLVVKKKRSTTINKK